MLIKYIKNTTPIKSFNFGVMDNNNADKVEFVLDKIQSGLDLSTFTAYVKSASPTLSFVDKQAVEIDELSGGEIKITWVLLRKHTSNNTLNVQLQFEDTANDVVWQTVPITFRFAKTIEADEEIENAQPSVLQELCARVSALEENETVVSCFSYLEFPTVGAEGVLYVDTEENKLYRWDDGDLKYYCVGSGAEDDIEIIIGGIL